MSFGHSCTDLSTVFILLPKSESYITRIVGVVGFEPTHLLSQGGKPIPSYALHSTHLKTRHLRSELIWNNSIGNSTWERRVQGVLAFTQPIYFRWYRLISLSIEGGWSKSCYHANKQCLVSACGEDLNLLSQFGCCQPLPAFIPIKLLKHLGPFVIESVTRPFKETRRYFCIPYDYGSLLPLVTLAWTSCPQITFFELFYLPPYIAVASIPIKCVTDRLDAKMSLLVTFWTSHSQCPRWDLCICDQTNRLLCKLLSQSLYLILMLNFRFWITVQRYIFYFVIPNFWGTFFVKKCLLIFQLFHHIPFQRSPQHCLPSLFDHMSAMTKTLMLLVARMCVMVFRWISKPLPVCPRHNHIK